MQGKQAINTFNEGMVEDTDILHTKSTSYRYSMNGRLMFNKNGTYSWETENGSKTSFIIDARNGTDNQVYIPTGNTGNDNIRLIWSVREDEFASEIGIFSINESGIGSYKTLFNDQDDPNGDSLNLLLKNQIEARFVYENNKCIRAYWVDGVADDSNRPRVVTFSYDPNIGNVSDVNAYSGNNISVHSLNSQSDFHMGIIKYKSNIGGNLLTGVYQYTYKLVSKDGYGTPFYPLTRRVFVCNSAINNTNWNEYEFISSGLQSSVGNLIEVKGIDQRYDEIQVAYTLTFDGIILSESKVFAQLKIIADTMDFRHTANTGDPLLPEEISDLFSGIVGAKTLNIKDSTLYYGNIKENLLPEFDIESVIENVTMKPHFRDMRSDEWAYGSLNAKENPPITHGYPRTGGTEMQQHSAIGGIETYEINKDYVNYKGTQIDHLYGGYFRGETYRMGIVFYDKLGFESFAFHLGDFRFPDQTEKYYNYSRVKENGDVVYRDGVLSERAWTTNNYNFGALANKKVLLGDTGSNDSFTDPTNPSNGTGPSAPPGEARAISHLRIMGLEISGIDVSSIQQFISGFKIVRVKRDSTILLQGLLLPTVQQEDDNDGAFIAPLPGTHQNFYDFAAGHPPFPGSSPGNIGLSEPGAFHGENDDPNVDRFHLKPNVSVYYAPAIDFGTTTFPALQSQDELVLVGGAFDEQQKDQFGVYHPFRQTYDHMWYNKCYYTKNDWHLGPQDGNPNDSLNVNSTGYFSANPYPRYMSRTNIAKRTTLGLLDAVPDWDGFLRLNNYVTINVSGEERRSQGKPNSHYLKHGNFNHASPPPGTFPYSPLYKNSESTRTIIDDGNLGTTSQFQGGFIANYTRPNPNPYGGLTLSSLEQSIFISTGHFQPINNPTFDAQGMPAGLVFDNIEVFGGDCYLDYHSFLRTYPWALWEGSDDEDDDFSVGWVFPWENEYNHVMREAGGAGDNTVSLIWANVGARPSDSLLDDGADQWDNGLYSKTLPGVEVLEQFNINATMDFEESLIFYSPKPVNFKDNNRYPVRWRYTKEKFYGDPVDTWRTFQVNDFRDLNGEHGEITSSLYIFNQIYSWQVSAFGRLRASDRALIESAQGGTLSTGIGDKLDGVDYVSTEFGNQHQWGLFGSDTSAYWTDVNKRKIMKFAQDGKQPLSDLRGIHQFLEEELPLYEDYDNPVLNRGVHGVFDYGNNEAIFTFNRDRTISGYDSPIDLISRHYQGKTFSPLVIRENETVVINPGINGLQVNLPIGTVGNSINENTIMYLFVSGVNNFTADIYNLGVSSTTFLFSATPNKYYRLFRYDIESPWLYEEVNADDLTPYRSSLTYNESENYFQGYHSFSPTHYIPTKFLVLSYDNVSGFALPRNVYAHDLGLKGDFPAFSKKSVLSVSMNEAPMAAKTFDSLRVNSNEDFNIRFDTFLMNTETQFRLMNMQTDTRKEYLEDILRFPLRDEVQDDRMRGKHILMTFEMKNNSLYNDRITNLVTYYRPSNRL